MPQVITEEAVETALGELGRTSQEIAASLIKLGCRGMRFCGEDCPLSRFLENRFPGYRFNVDHEGVVVFVGDLTGQQLFDTEIADSHEEFIFEFDEDGLYPELWDNSPEGQEWNKAWSEDAQEHMTVDEMKG